MSGRTGSAVGRNTPIVEVGGNRYAVTRAQYALLKRVLDVGGAIYVSGGAVRTARSMGSWGRLTDNGALGTRSSNVDGERYTFELTAKGVALKQG